MNALKSGIFGWNFGMWPALDQLIQNESGWNPRALNPSSGAWGLFQFLGKGPPDWNEDNQPQSALQYIPAPYRNPSNAWSFWQGHHWYKHGGLFGGSMPFTVADSGRLSLLPGMNAVYNGLGRTEDLSSSGVTVNTELHFNAPIYGEEGMREAATAVLEE